MTEQDIIAAIDVGTTKVLALLAAIDGPGRPRILAHSVVPCEGLERGNVTDVAKTTEAVRAALNRVEAETGLEVRAAHVGVSGSHVDYENRRDSVRGVGSVGVITKEELSADLPNRASALEDHRELLHAVPLSYTVDGEEGIRNPVGMHSATVEVDTHLISADRSRLDRLTRAVREAGVEVDELIMEPLASGMAVLTARGHAIRNDDDRHRWGHQRCGGIRRRSTQLHRSRPGRRIPIHQRYLRHLQRRVRGS